MKFRTKHSSLLLLLLPSITSAVAPPDDKPAAVDAAINGIESGVPIPSNGRREMPTKDAPVDGKDGKPHLGPFVETDSSRSSADTNAAPPLKGWPEDPTLMDGKKIPESNDGVMFDKNRERPQQGTTGTEGGVTEKDKARKAKEGLTGEKVVTQPESPKEQPPLPHSEERKIYGDKEVVKDKEQTKPASDKDEPTDYTAGLGVSGRSALLTICPNFVPRNPTTCQRRHMHSLRHYQIPPTRIRLICTSLKDQLQHIRQPVRTTKASFNPCTLSSCPSP